MSENDPFESFRTMTTSDLAPLPAAEVRRRGDRLRRRNTALAVVGGTLAAAVTVGVPIALTQGADTDDSLPIANDPSAAAPTWRTSIPEGFPLTARMPKTNVYSGTPVEARADYVAEAPGPCGGEAWDVAGSLDTLQAVWQASEGGMDRTMTVYADDVAAAQRLDTLSERARSCASQDVRVNWFEEGLGEQSVVFVNTWDDGIAYLHQAVRVGNAVLYTTSYFNGGGDPDVVAQMRELERERSADLIAQMCVFSADPC